MKIKSNVRAGAGSQKPGQSSRSLSHVVVTYVPPVSRCVGI